MIQKALVFGAVSIASGLFIAVGFKLGEKLMVYCESPRFKDDISKLCDFGERVVGNVHDGLKKSTSTFVNTTEV